jgi:hypothetical protein
MKIIVTFGYSIIFAIIGALIYWLIFRKRIQETISEKSIGTDNKLKNLVAKVEQLQKHSMESLKSYSEIPPDLSFKKPVKIFMVESDINKELQEIEFALETAHNILKRITKPYHKMSTTTTDTLIRIYNKFITESSVIHGDFSKIILSAPVLEKLDDATFRKFTDVWILTLVLHHISISGTELRLTVPYKPVIHNTEYLDTVFVNIFLDLLEKRWRLLKQIIEKQEIQAKSSTA